MEKDEQKDHFRHFDIALEQFNMSDEQKLKLYQLISGILYLSLIKFEDTNGQVSVHHTPNNAIQNASDLLSINSTELIQTITIKKIGIGIKNGGEIR